MSYFFCNGKTSPFFSFCALPADVPIFLPPRSRPMPSGKRSISATFSNNAFPLLPSGGIESEIDTPYPRLLFPRPHACFTLFRTYVRQERSEAAAAGEERAAEEVGSRVAAAQRRWARLRQARSLAMQRVLLSKGSSASPSPSPSPMSPSPLDRLRRANSFASNSSSDASASFTTASSIDSLVRSVNISLCRNSCTVNVNILQIFGSPAGCAAGGEADSARGGAAGSAGKRTRQELKELVRRTKSKGASEKSRSKGGKCYWKKKRRQDWKGARGCSKSHGPAKPKDERYLFFRFDPIERWRLHQKPLKSLVAKLLEGQIAEKKTLARRRKTRKLSVKTALHPGMSLNVSQLVYAGRLRETMGKGGGPRGATVGS